MIYNWLVLTVIHEKNYIVQSIINDHQWHHLISQLLAFQKKDMKVPRGRMMPSDGLDCRAGFWCAVWCGSLHFVPLVSQLKNLTHNCDNQNHPKQLLTEISLCQCASGGFSKQDLRSQPRVPCPRTQSRPIGPMHRPHLPRVGPWQFSNLIRFRLSSNDGPNMSQSSQP